MEVTFTYQQEHLQVLLLRQILFISSRLKKMEVLVCGLIRLVGDRLRTVATQFHSIYLCRIQYIGLTEDVMISGGNIRINGVFFYPLLRFTGTLSSSVVTLTYNTYSGAFNNFNANSFLSLGDDLWLNLTYNPF